MTRAARDLGPVDVAVIGLPDHAVPHGAVRAAMARAVDSGAVRVLDLLLVMKDHDGALVILDAEDPHESAELLGFPADVPDLLGQEDAVAVGEALTPGSAALVVAWENTWAKEIAGALDQLDAELLHLERVPPTDVEAALDAIAAASEGSQS